MVYNLQLEDWKLKAGYWWVEHKIFLKRLFIFFLILFDVLLTSLSSIAWINYYSRDIFYLDKMLNEFYLYHIDYKGYFAKHKPHDPIVTEIGAIKVEKNRYNFFAKVKNPNQDWVIKEIRYYFIFNGQTSPLKKNFILPEDEKFLATFNIESSSKVYRPTFKIASIKWKRLKKAERDDFIKKAKEYFNFEIKDIKFRSNIFSSYSDKKPQSEIQFTITNKTLYNFYEVGLILATYSGPSLTSINYYKIFDFPPEKTLHITKRWTGVVSRPSEIIITPDIPIWEENIIKPIKQDSGLPK